MPFPTGAEILAFVGVTSPSAPETAWANACAKAIEDGVTVRLNGAAITDPLPDELYAASMLAGAEAYKRREATFGSTGYADLEGNARAVARDYLEGIKPIADRYGNGPGIG
jgi:hypothetical protein